MTATEILDHVADPFFGFGDDRQAGKSAVGIVAIRKRALGVGIDQGRVVPERKPVRCQRPGECRFADATFRGSEGDHTKHRTTFMNWEVMHHMNS